MPGPAVGEPPIFRSTDLSTDARQGGEVVALFKRRTTRSRVATLDFVAGRGIVGEDAARTSSSRHVLLASAGAIVRLGLEPGALGENLLVDGLCELESGTTLRVGTATIRITVHCETCRSLVQKTGLPASQLRPLRGVLAIVVGSGNVQQGDSVVVQARRYLALSTTFAGRLAQLIDSIPPGQVASLGALVDAAGGARGAARAAPAILRRISLNGAPVHRVLRAATTWEALGSDQRRLLMKEGLDLRDIRWWDPISCLYQSVG